MSVDLDELSEEFQIFKFYLNLPFSIFEAQSTHNL